MSKTIERNAVVPFTTQQMYDLVNDIETYPSFMPDCRAAAILEQGENWLKARLDLGKAGIHQSFVTRNTMTPPSRIEMNLVEGPFKLFHGLWQFEDIAHAGCKVSFRLQYKFANLALSLAAGGIMSHMAGEQVEAICRRARTLYTPVKTNPSE